MDEKLLLEQIDAFVAENRENVLRDLKTLVDINSVEGQPQPGAPFGPGPRKALEAALDIAAGMGLDAHNCEGYIGYADLPGASPTHVQTYLKILNLKGLQHLQFLVFLHHPYLHHHHLLYFQK